MIEVPIGNRSDVVTTEDSDLEVLRFSQPILLGNLRTSTFQVRQGLEYDAVGTNVLGDLLGVAVMRDQLVRRRQIDTIDMSMSVEIVSNVFIAYSLMWTTYVISGAQLAK